MEYIYSPEEFENISGNDIQQKAQEIKQRFDFRRSYFHTLRNSISDIEEWTTLNERLILFDKDKFNPWSKQWNSILRSSNINTLKNYFESALSFFQELEEEVGSIKPQYLNSDEVESLKEDVLNRIDEDMISLKNDVLEQINTGIANVLDLKSELGLQKNFADNLKVVRRVSNVTKFCFLIAFIFSLIGIACFLVFSYKLDYIQNLEFYEKILVRLGAVSSLAILSYFLFQQFKLHQILHLKYTHLDNFLGGGATYINQLVSQDGDLKKITNKRLTEMFMEIDDTIGNAKQVNHPTDKYAESLKQTLDSVLGKVNDLAKTVKEIKNP
ncbi:hypothetical protein AB1A65_13150 [Muricauda sp. ANG21]|uniref:hypothetical protein n=1 Tax=Allomuricauda sp. ANG21 TaxID=3042468 RepID=UPI003456EFE9